MYSNYFEAVWW